MNPPSPHLTPLDFDCLRLGTLGTEEATLRAHISACHVCQQQQENREALADQFTREILPRSLPVLRARLASPRRRRLGGWWLALAPAACGVALAVALVRGHHGTVAGVGLGADDSDLGVKGGGGLVTYVRHGSKVARLVPGSALESGDALRFAIEPRNNAYLLIAGVDGSGSASAYYPFGQWQSAPLMERGRFEVPGSIVLDTSAGPERIFAFLSHQPIDGNLVRTTLEDLARRGPQAIRSSHNLQVPGADTSSVMFEKREKAQ
jgi:hypothetical protein